MAQSPQTPFIPKQATPFSAAISREIMGNVSHDIVTFALSKLPPLSTESIVHDNGCGNGPVTEVLKALTAEQRPSLIHATDLHPFMISGLISTIESSKWEETVKVQIMDSHHLSFPDETFTHSFSNLLLAGLKDKKTGIQEVYRTLKPGGKAMVSMVSAMPHDIPIHDANRQTRGENVDLAVKFGADCYDTSHLKENVVSGGFKEEDVEVYTTELLFQTQDLERWTLLMWSFLGARAGEERWLKEDEAKWEEAVNIVYEGLKKDELVKQGEDGVWNLRFPIGVVIGTKK